MSAASFARPGASRRGVCRWAVGLLLTVYLVGPSPAAAGGKKAGRGEVASPAGTVLVQPNRGGAWEAPSASKAVTAGDLLAALPGVQGEVDFPNGLRLTLTGLAPGSSPSPALESVVRLDGSKDGAVELTLERGRVHLSHQGKKKPVRVKVNVLKEEFCTVELREPGTEVLLERSGYWAPGERLPQKPAADRLPTINVVLVVLKGEVHLRLGDEEQAVRPIMLYQWSSVLGGSGLRPLKELPPALAPAKVGSVAVASYQTAANRLRSEMAKKPPVEALRAALQSPAAATRKAAVYAAAALGELGVVLGALGDAKHADVRQAAVLALRHRVGNGGEQAPELYKALLAGGARPARAETFLYLLQSFSADDRGRPETYGTLIDYLQHPDLRVRELAAWQLYRLVPQGKDIPYDAAASSEALAEARAAWRRLIPPGRLPPKK